MSSAGEGLPSRIVFVGLPGSGKSTVGRLVAARLGYRFVDLDLLIEDTAGRTVSDIFAEQGEPEFRRWEREVTAGLAGLERIVIAPGGGWISNPGARESLGDGVMMVYLRVSSSVAADRIAGSGNVRPLIQGASPMNALDSLLKLRQAAFESADLHVDTETLTSQEVADAVLRLARRGSPE